MKIRIYSSIQDIPSVAWNELVKENHPLIRHEFLAAMEQHHCVGEKFGWLPRHIGIYEGQRLIGAMPLYEKFNSLGEFVFDHAWANAYQRLGMDYFPKLVSAIPYTPIKGQRLLSQSGRENEVFPILLETALQYADKIGASSFHCLFPDTEGVEFLSHSGLLTRNDCQFHWHNQGYRDFEDFLASLSSRKRKLIRQERRKVVKAGIALRILDGSTATEKDWKNFTRFYYQTFEEKWGVAVFNKSFFQEVAGSLPGQVLLVMADLNSKCIAGALMFRSDNALYGRHWGCIQYVDCLHFEVCYYQGIEFCINQGLQSFEPGAQGEHKLARGFLPVLTRSSHWLANERLKPAVEDFVLREQKVIAEYIRRLQSCSPYKRVASP